jgi:hypothetical protein
MGNKLEGKMNIDELKQAKELLYKQISPKLTGKKEQSLLISSIADLQLLIKRLENPEKSKKMDKLVNGI